jgi:replicative superfamily II helicase
MRVGELEKWGIPSRIIERWSGRQGESLLPVQGRAVRKGLIGQPGNNAEAQPVRMLISAPTSSGKSFCAELAAIRAITMRQKTVILMPLKSLAEQKYDLFVRTYGDIGIKILIVTGDHPENDARFAAGDYQIAIAIYEKFDLMLTASLDALATIGLVVIDEIQTICEPGRGAMLERLLTKIRASVYEPSLVGLSAVIGDDAVSAGRLAEWLDAVLVEETTRPVDLMRGVAVEGSYQYRFFNNGLDGSEPFVRFNDANDPFEGFVEQIKKDDGSTLVFLKSRMETVDRAFQLAAKVSWPEAKQALERLDGEEPSFLVRSLRQSLSRGVAFHNADLSPHQRRIVEQAFMEKEVKVLFSTTTLAMGVNLPADTVYLETVKYTSGKYDDRPSLIPVSKAEFDNMTGRAGRLGMKREISRPGRAIVIAESEFDRDILWETYIAADRPAPMISAFASMPPEDWLLDMIVCGLLDNTGRQALQSLFEQTLYSHIGQQGELDFTDTLELLTAEGLVTIEESGGEVSATSMGQAVARTGLSVRQAIHYLTKFSERHPESDSDWIAFVLQGPAWHLPPAILTRVEQMKQSPLKLLYRQFDHLLNEAARLFGGKQSTESQEPLSYRQAASLKAFLLLEEWRQLTPVQRLEERYQMHLGQILNLGDTTAHLLRSVGELIAAIDRETPFREHLKQLAFEVRYGLPFDLQPIHERLGSWLSRSDFDRISRAGVGSLEDLCTLPPEELSGLITGKEKLNKVTKRIEELKQEVHMATRTNLSQMRPGHIAPSIYLEPESVIIDGTFERERYLVKINGFPVRLTGKSFKYFAKLAWSRVNRDSGWIYKEDIEVGFNQARYLYRMKGELADGLNISWPIIENNRLGYYRLNVDPSRIDINVENLKDHPDYEVRQLVINNELRTVN